MKRLRYYWMMMVVGVAAVLSGCGSGEEAAKEPNTVMPLTLTFAVPTSDTTSDTRTRADVPDPGDDTYDRTDWDRLTVIVAYKTKTQSLNIVDDKPGQMVYYDTFTKEQFEQTLTEAVASTDANGIGGTLGKADDNGYRQYIGYVPLGTCRVYGVTYSANQGLDLETTLKNMTQDGADKTSTVEALQISNDYATKDGTMDISKFLSVGSGYARKLDTSTGSLSYQQDMTIAFKDETDDNSVESKEYWRMLIRRLATKLDIQWDANTAWEKNTYQELNVNSFTYDGGSTSSDEASTSTGYGRLFPTLQSSDVAAVGGQKTFINTSAISKRYGRVYHYFFPDGSKQAKATFNIQWQLKDDTETKTTNYTFDFTNYAPLQSATWYKVNATISGSKFPEGSNTITFQNN